MVWIVALEIRGVCADVVKILKRNLSYSQLVNVTNLMWTDKEI